MQGRMTAEQAEALAGFLVTLRPGQRAWTKTACFDALRDAATRHSTDPETLARAAIRAALTAKIRTPDVIAMPGAHWEAVDATPPPNPVKATRCDRCHAIHVEGSPCRVPSSPATQNARHEAAESLRELLAKQRETHCRHHVPLIHCDECKEDAA